VICPRYLPLLGGIETHVSKISESLIKRGVGIEVLTTDPRGDLPREQTIRGVPVKRFRSRAPMDAFYFSGPLKSYIRSHFSEYDVVHAHSYHAFPALYAAQVAAKGPRSNLFVFTPHYHRRGSSGFTSFLHLFYRPWYGTKLFAAADAVVCVSKYERSLVEEDFPKARPKVVSIPNGIDPPADRASQNAPAPGETTTANRHILYVGRVEPYKRVDRIVRALPYMARDDVTLTIVGNGRARPEVARLARRLGVGNRVSFLNDLSDEELDRQYRGATALVNLSKFEAYGLTVAEALSRGTPCVVAESSALSEWVDGVNCLGVRNADDPRSVAAQLDSVLGRRAAGVKLQTWDEIAVRLLELYEGGKKAVA
jgi:glycosyltransferase involved in cell wall biosynthesis